MKKLLFAVAIFFSVSSKAQNLDTVNVSLTLRAQDWAWAVGKYGHGNDSTSKARIRALRAAIIAANPATWVTNVTINNVNGHVAMYIYRTFLFAPFGEVFAMGNTTAERTTIYTNIRAVNNSALQYFIGLADGQAATMFINSRQDGKGILMDN
jgi:hypothetical protein